MLTKKKGTLKVHILTIVLLRRHMTRIGHVPHDVGIGHVPHDVGIVVKALDPDGPVVEKKVQR
jgi:hypothetical protein